MKSLYWLSSAIWYGTALAVLIACAPMPHTKVVGPDWASFTVTEHRVSPMEAIRYCYRHVPAVERALGGFARGCAEVSFANKTCDYWCASESVCRHERLHCQGYSHNDGLQAMWERYSR